MLPFFVKFQEFHAPVSDAEDLRVPPAYGPHPAFTRTDQVR